MDFSHTIRSSGTGFKKYCVWETAAPWIFWNVLCKTEAFWHTLLTFLISILFFLTDSVKEILLFSSLLWDDMWNMWKMCRKIFHNRQFHPCNLLRSWTESHPIFHMSEIIPMLFFKIGSRSQWEVGAVTWNRRDCVTCRNLFFWSQGLCHLASLSEV